MTYWSGADLPFYHGLAETFPVADRWFCSCLGPTFPNRRFLISGTAHGLIDDLPFCMVDYPPAGTIFDLLDQHGISWVNYHNVSPIKILLTRLLGRPGLVAARRLLSLARWVPPVVNAVKGNKTFTADLYPLGRPELPAPPQDGQAVLHRRRQRDAPGVQHRRSRLWQLLRGEPAGHPQG
jgi:hypothetical protein